MTERNENSADKHQLKSARVTAVIIAIATVVCLFGIGFAFIQKKEADKARSYTEGIQLEGEKLKVEVEQQRVLAEQAFKEREVVKNRLRECEGRAKR
jgi:hypothetical protein